MTKHTPGPWHAASIRIYTADNREIGVATKADPKERYKANENARLIAAAPELLEALDDLVLACELPGDHCEVEQALPAARAAIRKAVGGLP